MTDLTVILSNQCDYLSLVELSTFEILKLGGYQQLFLLAVFTCISLETSSGESEYTFLELYYILIKIII